MLGAVWGSVRSGRSSPREIGLSDLIEPSRDYTGGGGPLPAPGLSPASARLSDCDCEHVGVGSDKIDCWVSPFTTLHYLARGWLTCPPADFALRKPPLPRHAASAGAPTGDLACCAVRVRGGTRGGGGARRGDASALLSVRLQRRVRRLLLCLPSAVKPHLLSSL